MTGRFFWLADLGGSAAIIRLNSDGSIDTSFGNNGEALFKYGPDALFADANDVAIQADGKIVAVGDATESNGHIFAGIERLNANGTIDTTFHGTGSNEFTGVVTDFFTRVRVTSGGKLLPVETTSAPARLVTITSSLASTAMVRSIPASIPPA